MSNFWLLRHGSSESNEGVVTADSWQIPLTAKGYGEAREAAHRWSTVIGSRQFRLATSPLLRARQTAEQFQVAYPQVAIEVVKELREFDPYDFSHLPAMRPDERLPLMRPFWARCDPEHAGEGERAESFVTFLSRVEVALARLALSEVETLAVCHGGVIKLAELLLESGSHRLDPGSLMRAWYDKPAVPNCGLRLFESRDRP